MYGKYHINTAAAFYNAGDAWSLSQSAGAGSPTAALQNTVTTNAQGQTVTGPDRADVADLPGAADPGQSAPTFNIMEAYVPVSQNDSVQTLAGFVFGNCDYGSGYGKLTVFETPAGMSIDGPALVDARILANTTVSKRSPCSTREALRWCSEICWSCRWTEPSSTSGLFTSRAGMPTRCSPEVIGVYGGQGSSQVYMQPTLGATLSDIFGTTSHADDSDEGFATSVEASAGVQPGARLLSKRNTSFVRRSRPICSDVNLGQYQTDVDKLLSVIQQLDQLTTAEEEQLAYDHAGTDDDHHRPDHVLEHPVDTTSSTTSAGTDELLDGFAVAVEHADNRRDGLILGSLDSSPVFGGLWSTRTRWYPLGSSPRGGAVW